MKYPLVKIEWIDSGEITGWRFKDEINFKAKTIMSVGYLVKKTDRFHALASHITDIKKDDYQCCGVMCIPNCSILKQEKIEKEKK